MVGKPVRMLVLGTGGMARNHVENLSAIPGVTIVAGVDTRPEQLTKFCDDHKIAGRFSSLDDAIKWGQFDAATNVTPDPVHYPTTMALLAAGKHVLCEKPLATDQGKAREMADAAAKAGVVNMVNLTYRNVPALQKAALMVAAGDIGTVRHFEASYLQSWLTQVAWGDWKTGSQWLWRLSSKHGSKGVLGDIGIHIIDFATFVAGSQPAEVSCRLKTFHKVPGDRIGEYVLDANDSFVMHMALENGALGTVSATRFATGHHNDLRLRIYGDLGGLEVSFEKAVSRLRSCLGDAVNGPEWAEVETEAVPMVYQRFIAAIRGEGAAIPDFNRGAELQRIIDLAELSDSNGGKVEIV